MDTVRGFIDQTRALLSVDGADAETFLQGLLSNDVKRAGVDALIYAALLTPQGKYLFDMLVWRPSAECFRLDVSADRAPALIKRLTMYKLRATVSIAPAADLAVALALGDGAPPEGVTALADPRSAELGRRLYGRVDALAGLAPLAPADYAQRRLELGVPLDGVDLVPEDTFLLDADFERLHGVDFKKGCFVGQEVTARMKHKTDRKKRLYRLRFDGAAPETGAEITAQGKPAGRFGSAGEGVGLAILRADRAEAGSLSADGVTLEAESLD